MALTLDRLILYKHAMIDIRPGARSWREGSRFGGRLVSGHEASGFPAHQQHLKLIRVSLQQAVAIGSH
jgi:hypothetical protein